MGMFDSFYDDAADEWQTKAFGCALDVFRIGDKIPADSAGTFQVEILGPCGSREPARFSLATIRQGVVASIDDAPDMSLLLLDYSGHVLHHGHTQETP